MSWLFVVMALAPWAPIVAFNYWLNPRVCYAPSLGLVAVAGSALSFKGDAAARRGRVARGVVAGVVAAAAMVLSVHLLGVQRAFRDRAEQDTLEMAALRRLWPDPPAGTVFAPARLALPPRADGLTKLDYHMWSALSAWWSARWCVQLAYRRSDLDSGYTGWTESALMNADRNGAMVRGVGPVPWARIAAFEVDGRGAVTPVTGVRVARGERVVEFALPLGVEAARRTGEERVVVEVKRSVKAQRSQRTRSERTTFKAQRTKGNARRVGT